MPINKFRGEYYFLSNFYPCPHGVEFEGDLYPTSEHAYQAAKIEERNGRESFTIEGSLGQSGPMVAKMKGKHVHMRPSWGSNKAKYMEVIVRSKFARDPKLTKDLLETGDQKIVEGHTGDKFWGGKANHLGNILMKIREETRRASAISVRDFPEKIEAIKPRKKQNKGRSFEVVLSYGEDTRVLYPDVTQSLIEIWRCNYCMDPENICFNLVEPPQKLELECQLFEYADLQRQVFVTAEDVQQ